MARRHRHRFRLSGAVGLRHFVHPNPISGKGLADFRETLEIERLDQKRVCTQLISPVYITHVIRVGQHYHAHLSQIRLLPNPLQHIQTVKARHLDVKQHKAGQRILATVGVSFFSNQILYRLLTASYYLERVGNPGLRESSTHQPNVIVVIIDKEK
jgi:hypothetical protein